MKSCTPDISVVIPSYGRPAALLRCLNSLLLQSHTCFEVIVVDDGSPEPLAIDPAPYEGKFQLRLIRQRNSGPASARNRGTKEATARWVAFTDDDCLPAPEWLETLFRELQSHPDALVGTLTFNGLPDEIMASASQLIIDLVYDHFNECPEEAYFLASNNIACCRETYLLMEGFDQSFPRAGAEDRDFCDRWRMSSRPIRLISRPLLEHRHHQTLGKFLDLHYRYGRGAFLYQKKRSQRRSGTMTDDLRFHSSLIPRLAKRLPHAGAVDRRIFLCGGIFLWQFANACGFFAEAIKHQLIQARKALHP